MKKSSNLKSTLVLSVAGTVFSGYLSAVKLFEDTCAFNETCPYFLGFPACYFGFVLFFLLLVSTVMAYAYKKYAAIAARVNAVVSGLGILFAVYISFIDLMVYFKSEDLHYTLLLPTCVYGAVVFIAVFVLSVIDCKKQK